MPMLDHITGLQYSKDGRKLLASYSGTRIFLLKADDDEEDNTMVRFQNITHNERVY